MVNINKEACTGCGVCVEVCPVEALTLVDDKITCSDACVDCGACTSECPFDVLSL